MKNTEEQILVKSKKILKDLNPKYFNENQIEKVSYRYNTDIARPVGKIMNVWVVILNEPITDSIEFLVLSDDTGEPLYIQSKHLIIEIEKNENGEYIKKL